MRRHASSSASSSSTSSSSSFASLTSTMAVSGEYVSPCVVGPIREQAAIFCGEPSCRDLQKLLLCAVDMVLETGSLAALVKTVVQLISALPQCVRSLCAEQTFHWHTGAHHEDIRSACAALAQIVTHVCFAFELCKATCLDAARNAGASDAGRDVVTKCCSSCLRRQTSSRAAAAPAPAPLAMSTSTAADADAEISVLECELWQDALAQWRLTLMLSLDSFMPCCHRALALGTGDTVSRREDVEHIFTMLSTLLNPSPNLYGESECYWIWRAAALHGALLVQQCVKSLAQLTELADSDTETGPSPVFAMACLHGLLLSPYWSRSYEVHSAMSGAVRIESMAKALAAYVSIVEKESTLVVAMRCIAAANRVWFQDVTQETKACVTSLKTALHNIALSSFGITLSDAVRLQLHHELLRLI